MIMTTQQFRAYCLLIDSNERLNELSQEARNGILYHLGSEGISTWHIFLSNRFDPTKSRWLCKACHNMKQTRLDYSIPASGAQEVLSHVLSKRHETNKILWKLAG